MIVRIVIYSKGETKFHLLTLTTAGMTEVSVEPPLTIIMVCSGMKVVVIPGSIKLVVRPGAYRYKLDVAASDGSVIVVVRLMTQGVFSLPACNTCVPQYDEPES